MRACLNLWPVNGVLISTRLEPGVARSIRGPNRFSGFLAGKTAEAVPDFAQHGTPS
jgi:hypothetical protein